MELFVVKGTVSRIVPNQRTPMKLRRKISLAAASLLVLAAVGISATPASAEPELVIPSCANMFNDPGHWPSTFATYNGFTPVQYRPSPMLYGSDIPDLRTDIANWSPGTNSVTCNWGLAKDPAWRNVTISEVHTNYLVDPVLEDWYAAHGIVGTDEDATLGGIAYRPSPNEWDVMMHGCVWVSITSRDTSVEGYTMQEAMYTLGDLNPWIASGGSC